MNYNTLTPGTRLVKKMQTFATGHLATSGEISNIAIINTTSDEILAKEVLVGIKSKGGAVNVFNIPQLGVNRVSPMTAKYAPDFKRVTAQTTQAIIKTNLIDAVVVIAYCPITTMGVLLGSLKANCPVIVLPLGQNHSTGRNMFRVVGDVFSGGCSDVPGKTNEEKLDFMIRNWALPKGLPAWHGLTHTFFYTLQQMGLGHPTYMEACYGLNTPLQIDLARKTGETIVQMAKDISVPRKLLTKNAFADVITKMTGDFCLSGLLLAQELVTANGEKLGHEFISDIARKNNNPKIVFVRGGACEDGGYVRVTEKTPIKFTGKAWVYKSLEDADIALTSGAIQEGVIVLHHCVGMDISQIVHTLEGMNAQDRLAVVTDGFCDTTDVLVVTHCRPSSDMNEDFANIQTGDVLEIDLAKARFNNSVSAKDLKNRAKRGAIKRPIDFFV